ncbi:MAG TPA: ABC transporter permease [Solirubrobacteraceae bacterium]|nr:ABC transporter permease [Solirubrobacteraceae bacterium]
MSSDAGTAATALPVDGGGGARRVGRLEPAALVGVMSRDVAIFGRNWRSTTFSSIVQPTVYLLAFGLGLGTLIARVGHVDYVQYVATGVVATAILFSSAFPGMFNTFVRWQFQRTYDAILAAPVDVEELVTAEVLWISLRASVYGLSPLLVGIVFGLPPEVGMLLVVPIGFVTGFGFACFGVAIAAVAKTIDNFSYITSAVLTPLFLVAGTFFPISKSKNEGLWVAAQFNPLYHCVELVRNATFGELAPVDLYHAAVLVAFGLLMWRLAVSQLGRRLID